MAVTPIRNMRVDDERWAAWEESANAAGVSITKLVVTTMDNAGHSRSGGPVVPEPAEESVVVEGPVGDVLADSRRLPPEVKAELWEAEDVLAAPLLEVAKKARRPRTKVCPHRIPETSYCRHCDGGT